MLKSLSPIDVALIKKIGGTSGSITVDSALSDTSTNPVQNKVIKSALDSLSDEIGNLGGGTVSVEPAEDDIPKVFINGQIPTTKVENFAELFYYSKTEQFHAYIGIKCQGSSSMSYAKKNFTVKLFEDEAHVSKMKKDFRGWGRQNKFVLKANWIDHTHARNIVSARLWADIVRSRTNYSSLPEELRTSPNQGGVDGFPVKVYANGVYQGIYTWNIPKDGWTYNMDDALENHAIVQADSNAESCVFRDTAFSSTVDWVDELHDSMPESIKTRWTEVLDFVLNSDDETFKANLDNYIDVTSAIDFYICCYFGCFIDSLGKNQMFLTYDGQKFYENAYDMDSTWGLWWDGGSIISASTKFQEEYARGVKGYTSNYFMERLESLFASEIKTRYAELRSSVLSIQNVINEFERFTDIICSDLYAEDVTVYPGIPSAEMSNIQQIRDFVVNRAAYVDEQIENLGRMAYTVTNNLDGCVNSNSAVKVYDGESYSCTITAMDGYTIESVECTMGGESQTVTDGYINIESVTGDIIITATATAEVSTIVMASSVDDLYPRAANTRVTIADGKAVFSAGYDYGAYVLAKNLVRWGDVKGKTLSVSVTGYADESYTSGGILFVSYGCYPGITSVEEITGNATPRSEVQFTDQVSSEQNTATKTVTLSGSFSFDNTTSYDDDTLFGCGICWKYASSAFTLTGISIAVE